MNKDTQNTTLWIIAVNTNRISAECPVTLHLPRMSC